MISKVHANKLLIVDDDFTFCSVIANAMKRRGFEVIEAHSVAEAKKIAYEYQPEYALVDLKMQGESGLVLIQYLHNLSPTIRIVMLTAYASVATAVEAIKLGATNYLIKPADADEVLLAFSYQLGGSEPVANPMPLSIKQLEWEYIQQILAKNNGNITNTAQELNMYRRTLQRKLAKNNNRNLKIESD